MFTALYDEAIYARLQTVRAQMEGMAEIFVPVGAKLSERPEAEVRLLFIGKATRDFGESKLASFAGARDSAIEILRALPKTSSPFFQFVREVTRDVLLGLAMDASDSKLASHCGWSNLAKIGVRTGNPQGKALTLQAPLCIETLRDEIAAFKPSGIIISNANYAANEIVRPVFGEGWQQDSPNFDGVAWKADTYCGVPVVWTNHPQGMRPAGSRAQAQKLAAEIIVGAMQGKPLPTGVAFSR